MAIQDNVANFKTHITQAALTANARAQAESKALIWDYMEMQTAANGKLKSKVIRAERQDVTAYVAGTFSNDTITRAFEVTRADLYAKFEGEQPFLYAYSEYSNVYMPAKTDGPLNLTLGVLVTTSKASEITLMTGYFDETRVGPKGDPLQVRKVQVKGNATEITFSDGNMVSIPHGPKGDRGDRGPQGPKGDPGKDGKITFSDLSPQQKAGLKGRDGAQGPKGDPGPQGPRGERGVAGPQGAKGNDGAPGPQGERGPAGPQGPRGNAGARGPQGVQGPPGPAGQSFDHRVVTQSEYDQAVSSGEVEANPNRIYFIKKE